MAVNAIALLGAVGAEKSLHTALGRWARYVSQQLEFPDAPAHAVALLYAASGEIQLSSPEGRFALRLSQECDAGGTEGAELTALMGPIGAVRGRGPLWQWYWRGTEPTFS